MLPGLSQKLISCKLHEASYVGLSLCKIFAFFLDPCFQFTFFTIFLPCYFCFTLLFLVSLPFVLCLLAPLFFSFLSVLCVTPSTFPPHRFCLLCQPSAPQIFFPNVSLSFPIWLLSTSTHVYFLAPVLLSTFPFQVLLCLILCLSFLFSPCFSQFRLV